MPRSVNPYAPLGQMYAELARGTGFAPKYEGFGSTLEAIAGEAGQDLAAAWAAGFWLAWRLGKLDAFERSVMDCNYYCPWAVVAMEMPGRGLIDFLRMSGREEDGGMRLYRTFFRLARRSSSSAAGSLYGLGQPFLVSEACVSKARFADAVYDERVITLAYQLGDLLIREPVRAQLDLAGLQTQHGLLVQAFVTEFAGIRLDAQAGSRRRAGVKPLVRDIWRGLSDTQQARIDWIAPLVTEPTRRAVRKTPAKSTRAASGKAMNRRRTKPPETNS
jgi:hypothetical protein